MTTSTRQTEKLQDKVESLTVSLVAANDSIKELKSEKKDILSVMSNMKSAK